MSYPHDTLDPLEHLPDPRRELSRLERERDGLPGLMMAAKRAGDRALIVELRARMVEVEDDLELMRYAVADLEADEAEQRVRLADELVEPARLAVVEAAAAVERAKAEYLRLVVVGTQAQGQYRAVQQGLQDAQRNLVEVDSRRSRQFGREGESTTQPTTSAAEGHQPVTCLTPGLWAALPTGSRRDTG